MEHLGLTLSGWVALAGFVAGMLWYDKRNSRARESRSVADLLEDNVDWHPADSYDGQIATNEDARSAVNTVQQNEGAKPKRRKKRRR